MDMEDNTAQTQKYERLKEQFTELCTMGLPGRLLEERNANAPREFDHLCGDPRIVCVSIQAPFLLYATCRLAMAAPGAKFYDVGEFAVRIDVKSREIACEGSERRWTSSDSAVWHPHVRVENNAPCFGTGTQKLTEMFADGKYAHVALYVLECLCLARGSNHYAFPAQWRELTLEEVTKWKTLYS